MSINFIPLESKNKTPGIFIPFEPTVSSESSPPIIISIPTLVTDHFNMYEIAVTTITEFDLYLSPIMAKLPYTIPVATQ